MRNIICLIIAFTFFSGVLKSAPQKEEVSDKNVENSQKSTNKEMRVQPLPANGAVQMFMDKERIAPLQIITRDQYMHYFVKLVDWDSNHAIQTIFIRSGESIETYVPLGSYYLKYAAGKEWFGEKDLFGDETVYKKADEEFNFTMMGNQVSGYTIELFLQPNGNLDTMEIPKSEW